MLHSQNSKITLNPGLHAHHNRTESILAAKADPKISKLQISKLQIWNILQISKLQNRKYFGSKSRPTNMKITNIKYITNILQVSKLQDRKYFGSKSRPTKLACPISQLRSTSQMYLLASSSFRSGGFWQKMMLNMSQETEVNFSLHRY